jgi:hypothetical protein
MVEKPAGEPWLDNIRETYKLVLREIVDCGCFPDEGIPWSVEQTRTAWRQLRKTAGDKLKLTCEVAVIHGSHCFYDNRGVGECSVEVDLDRIVPESRGGRYSIENCLIACSKHNRSRGDQTIESFLLTEPSRTD